MAARPLGAFLESWMPIASNVTYSAADLEKELRRPAELEWRALDLSKGDILRTGMDGIERQ